MFSGRNIAAHVYINIYTYISKVNSHGKIFFEGRTGAAGPAASLHPIAVFSAKTCAAACNRGPGSHALRNIAPAYRAGPCDLFPVRSFPRMGRPPWGQPPHTVTRAEKFRAFRGVTHKFFFLKINRTLAAGPLLDLRCVNFWAERWGPFSSGFGARCMGPPTPQINHAGTYPRLWCGWSAAAFRPYTVRPYAWPPA